VVGDVEIVRFAGIAGHCLLPGKVE
jgi:hypothetical protein